MFKRNKCLQQITELVGKLRAIRVLLDFTLALKAFTTRALERIDLISEQEGVIDLI